jgi:hypothetical protein
MLQQWAAASSLFSRRFAGIGCETRLPFGSQTKTPKKDN